MLVDAVYFLQAALETVRCEELQLELSSALRARGGGGGTTWSTQAAQPASEIERIMAKIEQDNRILAELEHTRSTTHGEDQLRLVYKYLGKLIRNCGCELLCYSKKRFHLPRYPVKRVKPGLRRVPLADAVTTAALVHEHVWPRGHLPEQHDADALVAARHRPVHGPQLQLRRLLYERTQPHVIRQPGVRLLHQLIRPLKHPSSYVHESSHCPTRQ